eukprot:2976086-Ditylum_brightwellii.AAC.1
MEDIQFAHRLPTTRSSIHSTIPSSNSHNSTVQSNISLLQNAVFANAPSSLASPSSSSSSSNQSLSASMMLDYEHTHDTTNTDEDDTPKTTSKWAVVKQNKSKLKLPPKLATLITKQEESKVAATSTMNSLHN